MEYFPAPLEKLVEQFARLPGIGRKTAQRQAFFVLSLPEEELALLVDFCQCELFGQVTNWLNQNMVYDIVAHVQALCRLFEGSIAQALEAAPMEA